MLAYRPLGREIALRRITVTHSLNRSAGKCNNRNRCGYDDQRDGHSAEARSMSIIPRTILPFAKSYWRRAGANEACAPKTPSAKHDLNWTVLRVMLGSFDFPSLSFAVTFLLRLAGGPTFWADLTAMPLLTDLVITSERHDVLLQWTSFPDPEMESEASGMQRVSFSEILIDSKLNLALSRILQSRSCSNYHGQDTDIPKLERNGKIR